MKYLTLQAQLDTVIDFDSTGLYWALQRPNGWALWNPRWVRAYIGKRPSSSVLRSH